MLPNPPATPAPILNIPQPIRAGAQPLDIAGTAQSVHTTLDGALAAVPPDQDAAFILHGTYDGTGKPAIQAIVAARGPDKWNFYVGAQWAGGTHVEAQFGVMKTWKWSDL